MLALALTVNGCSNDEAATTTPTTLTPRSTTTTTTGGSESTTTTQAPVVDLDAAIAAVGQRYVFESSVTVEDQLITRIVGRRYDGSTAMRIETGGAEAEYIKTPEGSWALGPDDEWVEVEDGAVAASDPLQGLASPADIRVDSATGTKVTVTAEYPGTQLGFETDDLVAVTIEVADGRVTRIAYSVVVEGKPGSVVTLLSAFGEADPVEAPTTG